MKGRRVSARTTARTARHAARTARRRGGPRRGAAPVATREAIAAAAADAFSRRGFEAVAVDDIASAAGVNKAMIYYHFRDKLGLYREIVREALDATGARIEAIAGSPVPPARKLERFIAEFVALTDARPHLPPLMLREIAEGAPHLDAGLLSRMRRVFALFTQILEEGQQRGEFRPIHPVLAYMSVLAPVLLNAARERAGRRPGRVDLPMFAAVPHDELTRHMQRVALQMLRKD